MCGICGLIDFKDQGGVDLRQAIQNMGARLVYWDSDAEGMWYEPKIAFGHRCVKVIDLIGNHQPMEDITGRYVMIYNKNLYLSGDTQRIRRIGN
jgi:asparagine synthase (glutamine-hydrolysing)